MAENLAEKTSVYFLSFFKVVTGIYSGPCLRILAEYNLACNKYDRLLGKQVSFKSHEHAKSFNNFEETEEEYFWELKFKELKPA